MFESFHSFYVFVVFCSFSFFWQFFFYIAQITEWKEDDVFRTATVTTNPKLSKDSIDIEHLQLLDVIQQQHFDT